MRRWRRNTARQVFQKLPLDVEIPELENSPVIKDVIRRSTNASIETIEGSYIRLERDAHAKKEWRSFFARPHVATADFLDGLRDIPVCGLSESVSFIVAADHVADANTFKDALAIAYEKADERFPDVYELTREEIAAINLYTQPDIMYRRLNTALWSRNRATVEPYWRYIKLLQNALFKLPEDNSDTRCGRSDSQVLYRAIKLSDMGTNPQQKRDELQRLTETNEPEIWWGFSSTSTSLEAAQNILSAAGEPIPPRLQYNLPILGGPRDVRYYSHFQDGHDVPEDERLLPCAMAVVITTVGRPEGDALTAGVAPKARPEPEPELELEPEPLRCCC
jgi:hypothetical protein